MKVTWHVSFTRPTLNKEITDDSSVLVNVEDTVYTPWGNDDTDVDRALTVYYGDKADRPYFTPTTVSGASPPLGIYQLNHPVSLIAVVQQATASDGDETTIVRTNLFWHARNGGGGEWYPMFFSPSSNDLIKAGWVVGSAGKDTPVEWNGYTMSRCYTHAQVFLLQPGDYFTKLDDFPDPQTHVWEAVLPAKNFTQ